MTTFDPSRLKDSVQMEFRWMSSAVASLVRTSLSPDPVQALAASAADYGESSPGLLASYDRASSSWRTSEPYLFEDWSQSLETLPPAGSMRNGRLYLRPAWGLHMPAKDYGFLPTPNARDWRDLSNSGQAYAASRVRHQPSLATRSYLAGFSGRTLVRIYEWTMGLPALWTNLGASATPSFRKSQN